MKIVSFQNIDQIPSEDWNSLTPETEIFNQHHFLKTLQASKVENARMEYVIIKDKEKLIATCVLSVFEINLDLFIGKNKIVQWLKNPFPNLFKINVLICGTPISAGHKNVYIKQDRYRKDAIKLIANYVDQYCQEKSIKYSIFKEFNKKEAEQFKMLNEFNYFKAYSLPTTILNHDFDSYEDYLSSLRYKYRRQIKVSLRKINCIRPVFVDNYFKSSRVEKHPVFTIWSSSEVDSEKFHNLYCCVMDRADSKLEILNKTFFQNFFQTMNKELKILAMVYKSKVLGIFILSKVKDELIFIWTGKEKDKDTYHTYNNLINAMVYYGIDNDCKKIIMGQTSYYPKQRMGAQVYDLFIYFKSYLGWKNHLLKLLNRAIFPKLKVNPLRVFKLYE